MFVVVAVAVAVAIAGCGDDGGGDAPSGPATVVPASAPVYVDLSVRPEGSAREGAEAALAKIMGTDDPGDELISLVEEEAAAQGESFDYEQQIAPWLGQRFAVFLTKVGSGTTPSLGAYVFETTDGDEALDFFNQAEDLTGDKKEYEGVEYQFDNEGDVLGRVGDFIVGGDEQAFKAAVDAEGGDSLAEAGEFEDSSDSLSAERLATLYVPPQQFLDSLPEGEFDSQERSLFEKALGDAADVPVLGEITASAESVTIELSVGGGGEKTSESGLLTQLPGDAWLALGLSDIGGAVQRGLDSVEKAGIPGFDAAAVRKQLRAQSGINLEQDIIEPLGDAGLFVRGTSVSSVGGALVIETSDPTASGELLNKIESLISAQAGPQVEIEPLASTDGSQGFQLSDPSERLQQPITVVQREDRIVAGYGGDAVNQALAGIGGGGPTLAENPSFKSAEAALDSLGIDAFLSLPTIFELAESTGAASDPDYQRAKPYLGSLESVAIGSGPDGDRSLLRFIVGLE